MPVFSLPTLTASWILSPPEEHPARVQAAKNAPGGNTCRGTGEQLGHPSLACWAQRSHVRVRALGSDCFVVRNDLHKVGAECKQLEIDFIMLEGDATIRAIEDDIRSDLAKIGINVRPRALNKTEFNEAMVSGDFHVFLGNLGPPYDPHSYAKSWASPDEAYHAALRGLP